MRQLFEIRSGDVIHTETAGRRLAEYILQNDSDSRTVVFVAMYGDLGAGKTAFVRGMAALLTPGTAVSSPTYALVNQYSHGNAVLYHFDLYRISGEDDLYSIGFYDYTDAEVKKGTLCVIAAEWCENIPYAIPERHYSVTLDKINADERMIRVCIEDAKV